MSIIEKGQKFWSRFRFSSARPPGEKYYIHLLALLVGFMLADLAVQVVRPDMLPTEAPPVRPSRPVTIAQTSVGEYNAIQTQNIFNEDGVIPPKLSTEAQPSEPSQQEAVPSQLPIQLLGTIVHFNPNLSIATVNLSSKNISTSVRVDEEIEGMAKVTKVERRKLTFVNLNNRRLEFIEIADDAAFSFGLQSPQQQKAGGTAGVVEKRGNFDFSVKRTDVENLTSNLSSLLQQARMEPVFSPDGITVEGFKFSMIQPGSIYEQLGFRVGDMIRSVNGEPVNSPAKAMEMYNLLKTTNFVQLGVERDGREERFNYSVQ